MSLISSFCQSFDSFNPLRNPLSDVDPPHDGQDVDLDVGAEADVRHPEAGGQHGEVERLRRHPEEQPDGVRRKKLLPPLSDEVLLALKTSNHDMGFTTKTTNANCTFDSKIGMRLKVNKL